jgi:hypothetical protein
MTPTVTVVVEYDPALIPSIAWQATLSDEDGHPITVLQGASAYDVTAAAAAFIDRHVADALRRQAVPA